MVWVCASAEFGCTKTNWPALKFRSAQLSRLASEEVRSDLARRLKELGFRYVTLDLEGFRSGSLNALVSLEHKRLFAVNQP